MPAQAVDVAKDGHPCSLPGGREGQEQVGHEVDAPAGPEQCPRPSARKCASNQRASSADRPFSPGQEQLPPACVMSGFKDSDD